MRKSRRHVQPHDAPTRENIVLGDADEENVYAASVDAGHKVDPRAQKIFVMLVVLVAVYVGGLILPKDLLNQALHQAGYSAGYSFAWFVESLQENVNGLVAVLTGNDDGPVPFSWTMLQYVVVALSGAGLALCGTVYQGTFKNALVSPSTLGVMSGATFGMMLWVVFCLDDSETGSWAASITGAGGASQASLAGSAGSAGSYTFEYLWSSYSLALFSFIGCIAVVALVLLVVRAVGRTTASGIVMIIVGQVIGAVMGAVVSTVRYYYVNMEPDGMKATFLTDMQIASFYRAFTLADVIAVGVPLLICFLVIMRLRQRMLVLTLSDDEARTMGVDARRTRILVVGVCTLLTAIIVSFCGRIGFVGFLVPHLARRLVGPNFTYLVPAATVLGAIFVLGAFILISATLGSDYETMTGMFVSIGGAVVFLATALRGKGGARGEFR